MHRYKVIVEYFGEGLAGFQRQENHISVQELLERSIERFSREVRTIYAAGRTDAGVHAFGQVVHFDLEKYHDPYTVMRAMNHFLRPSRIAVVQSELVNNEFHARFSAKARHYIYKINNRPSEIVIDRGRAWHVRKSLDAQSMKLAASYLIGKHDFTSFRALSCQSKSPIKTLTNIEVTQNLDEINIAISAPSFLHHMVRNIVGTLSLVGLGKWAPEDVKRALEAKNRSVAGPTAPAYGLYFVKVDY